MTHEAPRRSPFRPPFPCPVPLILLAVLAVSCRSGTELSPEFSLPEQIQSLALTERKEGADAAEMIGRLHGKEVAPEGSMIVSYGTPPNQVVLYVSRFTSPEEARSQVEVMGEAIGSGRSGFHNHQTTPHDRSFIHWVLGHGQKHAFFSVGDRIIWLAAPPRIAERALEEVLQGNQI